MLPDEVLIQFEKLVQTGAWKDKKEEAIVSALLLVQRFVQEHPLDSSALEFLKTFTNWTIMELPRDTKFQLCSMEYGKTIAEQMLEELKPYSAEERTYRVDYSFETMSGSVCYEQVLVSRCANTQEAEWTVREVVKKKNGQQCFILSVDTDLPRYTVPTLPSLFFLEGQQHG